ncbi:MAG: futalosine hydrolase [Bacteroidota bacterium]|nr:futalosine hydrolase [Bacteroidota bacterium]
MKVVITSATEREVIQIKQSLDPSFTKPARIPVHFHESGVGMLSSCFSISKLIFEQRPDLIIQAGIAGSFNNKIPLGNVVAVRDEIAGDIGVEENGSFKDLFDLNLQHPDLFPFNERRLVNTSFDALNYLKLPAVTGLTVNEITTRPARIEALKIRYQPAIESMEGASLHYCCLQTGTQFLQMRSISNYVGERDKSKWNFKAAFHNLTKTILAYIEQLQRRHM